VEIWSTSTLTAVYGHTSDATRHQRVVRELERLKDEMPCLELYWQRACAAHCLLTGDYANAVRLFELTLAQPGARERVGWGSVQGARARAYNRLGQYAQALAACEEAIASSEDDREFVALNLSVRVERCEALAGLGRFQQAKAELNALLARHAPGKNPLTVGTIHRTLAQVALLEKDWPSFEAHAGKMEEWFRTTENPALITQCAKLRHASGRHTAPAPPLAGAGAERSSCSMWRSLLSECRGSYERRQRALEIVAERVGAQQAWLLCLDDAAQPQLAAQLGSSLPAPSLSIEVRKLVREFLEPAQETCFIDATSAPDHTASHAVSHRLLPLTLCRDTTVYIAGVIAVPVAAAGWLEPAALQELAFELSGAGDIGALHEIG
jgi:tetratricopeptide (TPR) repeat protein